MHTPASIYRERAPAAALASHVLCVWAQRIGAGAAPHRQRVLPDGCIDLVWIGEAPAVVAGPATRTVMVPLAPHNVLVGVRLRPGAAPALGLPASELLDRATPLDDLWPADDLSARIAEQASVAARLAVAEAAVGRRIAEAAPADRCIAAAARWLARHPQGRIEDLARLLDLGDRRLHRRFVAAVGYGPKTLQRVLRLQRVLALAHRCPPTGKLALLAYEAGFADQAHMSRELRALTGLSPAALLPGMSSTLALSDLFKTEAAAAF